MRALFGWLKRRNSNVRTDDYAAAFQGNPQQQYSNHIAAAIQRFHYYLQIRHEAEERKTRKDYLWIRATTFSAIIAAIANAFAVAFTGYSLQYAYNALDASRESAKQAGLQTRAAQDQVTIAQAGSRPYIFIQIDKEHITEGGMATKPSGSGAYGSIANYRVINFGTTPAVIKEIDSEITIDFQRTDQYDKEPHITDMIFGQGQSSSLRQVNLPEPDNAALSLRMGEAKLYVSLRVAYTDTTGRNLYTNICYRQPFANKASYDTALKTASGPNCDNDRN